MVREVLRERFITALESLGGSAGNARLQSELGWQDETYQTVHAALLADETVVKGRGRGGSVSLASVAAAVPPSAAAAPAAPPSPRAAKANGRNGGSGFEQIFKAIDDVLWKEAGCTTELDYTEQTSWMLFLKYLDDLEQDRQAAAALTGRGCTPIIDAAHRWARWAAPKKADGSFDHDRAMTGDDLIAYVNLELFPYLQGFKARADHADTIQYKIGEIFGEIKSKFQSGYSLRDALELVDGLRFRSQQDKHELSQLYEAKIRNMGNAGRNGGEYYTPRPLIRAMIAVTKPRIGERIYDGAAGSAGFLCEAYDYLLPLAQSTVDREILQKRTFYAKEKKSLAYVIAIMNMILHGIEAPNVIHTNTLAENITDLQDSNHYDLVLANPPFGGKERPEVQQNFPIRTGETAFLFLQHFIKSLKPGGRAAVVIKNTFLSNTDNAAVALRRELLTGCDLHTVLDMPGGTFQGAGVKTVVLFFAKGRPTRKVWFYRLDPGRNLGKTNALDDAVSAEWVWKPLSVVCQIDPPKAEARTRLKGEQPVSFVSMSDLGILKKDLNGKEQRPFSSVVDNYTYFAEDDLLLAKITPCFENGKLGIARNLSNGIGFGSSEFIVLRPTTTILPEFVFYYLSQDTFRNVGADLMTGAVGQKRVSKDFVATWRIPVPPLSEQQRIVAILDNAFEGVAAVTANAEKNLANARELFESHLEAVFTCGFQDWPARPIKTLGEVFDGPHATPKTIAAGPIFLNIGALQEGELRLGNTRHVTDADFATWTRRVQPRENDFVFSYETRIGQAALIPPGLKACLGRRMGLLRFSGVGMNPQFFLLQYMSRPFQKFLSSRTLRGTTVDRISVADFPQFPVHVPERAEQDRVVALAGALRDDTDLLAAIQRSKLTALAELKQSLLARAFSGKLTASDSLAA